MRVIHDQTVDDIKQCGVRELNTTKTDRNEEVSLPCNGQYKTQNMKRRHLGLEERVDDWIKLP